MARPLRLEYAGALYHAQSERGQFQQSNIFCYRLSMARPLRLEYAGALYHVTSRGDRREDIYRDDEDREDWVAVLSQVCERFNWVVHALNQFRRPSRIRVISAYRRFIMEGKGIASPLKQTQNQLLLGDDNFVAQHKKEQKP